MIVSGVSMSACSGGSTGGSSSTARNPLRLTLWLPTDASTTPEAIYRTQEAINKITRVQYNTEIEMHAIADAVIRLRLTHVSRNK